MKKDLIEKIDTSLETNSDYREMTILTLESAKEVLQIYMNLESDYVASQKTLDDEIASFKDRTQEVKDKIDEFYSSSSITLEQVKQAEELCEAIKEQVLAYSKHIDEIQDKIEADKQEMEAIKNDTKELEKQSEENAKESTNALNEIQKSKTEVLEGFKEAFNTNLANLEELIADYNKKTQEAHQEIENSKSEFETLANSAKTEINTLSTDSINAIKNSKDEIDTLVETSKTSLKTQLDNSLEQIDNEASDIKTEVDTKKKEIIDSISSKIDELQNQKEDISRLLKSASNVAIEGTEVSVMTTGNIIHYSFEPGTALDGVDFINEKADNGVDKIIDKVQGLSTLNVGKGINLSLNLFDETKTNSYLYLNRGAKIGVHYGDNIQTTMSMNTNGTFFDNDVYVRDKKVLLQGDIDTNTGSNQKYFSITDFSLSSDLGSIPPEIENQKGYLFLSPKIWQSKTNAQLFSIDMNRYFGMSAYDLGESYGGEEAPTDFFQKAVYHYFNMGVADAGIFLGCRVPESYYSDSGINIVYAKNNSRSINITDYSIAIISRQIIDYDNVPEGSIPPAQPLTSQITITNDRVAIASRSLTFNGREILLK